MEGPLPHPPPNLTNDEDSRTTRIMDSFISQLSQLHPSLSNQLHHSSLVQRRLQHFFHSFHTPTHPPYALMIRRAITELNEGTGSTEEAISEFIKKEYNDLPWAHAKVLRVHLGKLCKDGEIVCGEGGRYVLFLEGKMVKQCKVSKKRKRGKKRTNHGDGKGKVAGEGVETERDNNVLQEEGIKEQIQVSELDVARTVPNGMVERTQEQVEQAHNQSIGRVEESENGGPEVVGQQSQHTEAQAPAQSELEVSKIQDSMLHLNTICSSRQTVLSLPVDSRQPLLVPISDGLPKCLPAAGIGLSPMQFQLQMSCQDAAAKMSGSLSSLNVLEHKQDENSMSVDPEPQHPNNQRRGRKPRKCQKVAEYQRESLLPSGSFPPAQLQLQMSCCGHSETSLDTAAKVSGLLSSLNDQEHKQDEKPISVDPEHRHPNRECRGRLPRKCKKDADNQGESLLPSGSLSPVQLQIQMSCHGHSKSSLCAAAKVSGSLSLNSQEHQQDENPMSVDPEHQHPNHEKKVADDQRELFLPSGDATVNEQEPNVKKIGKWWLSKSQGRGIGRGRRPKLHRNAHINKKIQLQDQAENLVCSLYSNQKETSYSSQPPAHNFPVGLTHNLGMQLVVPTSEGSPECIISTGIKLSPSQLQLQKSSDADMGMVSKRKASLTCENVHDGQPQYYNQGSLTGNVDENPMSRDSEQKPPKRPRGRPRKLETGANYPGESLFPLDDGIHNKQKQNINKLEKQQQCGRGRGRGRPPKKLNQNQNPEQCVEELQPADQAKQHGQGSGRGPGKPPKPKGHTIQYEEQSQQEVRAQQHGRGSGRRGRPPKLKKNTNKCETKLQKKVQAPQQHLQGRRGRPRKLNRNINQCEEQLQPQDQVQGLANSVNSGGNDSQSLEQKQLHVQSHEGCHKSESGEAMPPAGLQFGSESRCGSGEAYQSNVGSKPEPPAAAATSM